MRIPSVSMFQISSDGSVSDNKGQTIFLSTERFIDLMKREDACFLCGALKIDTPFNDEHVIPAWVQNFCNIRNKSILLPNNTRFPYNRYTIPCCVKCNSFLADTYETPISRAFLAGKDVVSEFFRSEGIWTIFVWINLIYLKVHIKDNYLRIDRDRRASDNRIGDFYPWLELYHCHALVRAKRFGIEVDVETVLGSTMSLHLGEWANDRPFDYNDHLASHTVMIRLRDVAFICVLNDSCMTFQGIDPVINCLPPNLNSIEFSELLTEFQFINIHIKERPSYGFTFNKQTGAPQIRGMMPENFDLNSLDFGVRGALMLRNLDALAPNFKLKGMDREKTVETVLSGEVSFLRGS